MMLCLRPEKRSSNHNKPWKCLISIFQKKLNHLKKPKPSNRTTQHSSHIPYHYNHRDKEEEDGGDDDDGDDNEKGEVGVSMNESSSMTPQLSGIDASAEEFIEKMKRRWVLERQISDENYLQKLAKSLYDCQYGL